MDHNQSRNYQKNISISWKIVAEFVQVLEPVDPGFRQRTQIPNSEIFQN